MYISAPVIIVDEVLKWVSRNFIVANSASAFSREKVGVVKKGKKQESAGVLIDAPRRSPRKGKKAQ